MSDRELAEKFSRILSKLAQRLAMVQFELDNCAEQIKQVSVMLQEISVKVVKPPE